MFKVLVVDDDENINLFISRLLNKKFNCTVETALNGLEALSKLKNFEAEVIFLDVTMPVMDGIETLEALKNDGKFKEVPVVMLTAVSERSIIEKAMKIGVVDYMLKPLIYETAYLRIKDIFTALKKRKERILSENPDPGENGKPSILVVHNDKDFRNVFRVQMQRNYKVLEAETGADGLSIFMKERPKVVCLGEKLSLLNEKLLAQKIKSISRETKIYAIRDEINLDPEEKAYYDMVIPNKQTKS